MRPRVLLYLIYAESFRWQPIIKFMPLIECEKNAKNRHHVIHRAHVGKAAAAAATGYKRNVS